MTAHTHNTTHGRAQTVVSEHTGEIEKTAQYDYINYWDFWGAYPILLERTYEFHDEALKTEERDAQYSVVNLYVLLDIRSCYIFADAWENCQAV